MFRNVLFLFSMSELRPNHSCMTLQLACHISNKINLNKKLKYQIYEMRLFLHALGNPRHSSGRSYHIESQLKEMTHVNAPALTPNQGGQYSTYFLWRDRRLSLTRVVGCIHRIEVVIDAAYSNFVDWDMRINY